MGCGAVVDVSVVMLSVIVGISVVLSVGAVGITVVPFPGGGVGGGTVGRVVGEVGDDGVEGGGCRNVGG